MKSCAYVSYAIYVKISNGWAGAGLLHARSRVFFPLPHVLLQGDQAPQADQCPSTGAAGKQKKNVAQNTLIQTTMKQ